MDKRYIRVFIIIISALAISYVSRHYKIMLSKHVFVPQQYESLGHSTQSTLSEKEYSSLVEWYAHVHDAIFFTFTYKSDGLLIYGVLAQPKPMKLSKYPLIIYNRGNGEGVGLTLWELEQHIYPLVKKGYVVIASQYRQGGGSQGADEFGGNDVHDVIKLLEVARTIPYVDKHNMFLVGYSRGSLMAYRMLQEQVPVNAAATIAGVTNLFNIEDFDTRVLAKFSKLIPNAGTNIKDELQKRSAVYWADTINVPLLLLHGQTDSTVRMHQSEELAHALQKYDKIFKLITYPECDHSLKGHCEKIFDEIDSWFRKYMR